MRSKLRRRAEVTSPLQNSSSIAFLDSDQSHHGPDGRGPLLGEVAGGERPALAHLLEHVARAAPAAPCATRRMPPHASSCARAMRQRSSGCSSTGIRLASWPQYSNSRRGA